LLTEHASSAHIQIGNTTTGDSNKIILDVSKARYGCFITLRFYGTYFLLNFVLVRNVTYIRPWASLSFIKFYHTSVFVSHCLEL